MIGADLGTFEILHHDYYRDSSTGMALSGYAKDAHNVYFNGRIVAGADVATFETADEPESGIDGRDRKHEYLRGEPVTYSSTYVGYTDSIYINEEYGFQVAMPKSWSRYAVYIDKQDEKTKVVFGLPLESDRLTASKEPERSSRIFDVRSLEIWSLDAYDEYVEECVANDNEMCFSLSPAARNDAHVFVWTPNHHSGWNFCDGGMETYEPYLCSVYGARGQLGDSLTLLRP